LSKNLNNNKKPWRALYRFFMERKQKESSSREQYDNLILPTDHSLPATIEK